MIYDKGICWEVIGVYIDVDDDEEEEKNDGIEKEDGDGDEGTCGAAR